MHWVANNSALVTVAVLVGLACCAGCETRPPTPPATRSPAAAPDTARAVPGTARQRSGQGTTDRADELDPLAGNSAPPRRSATAVPVPAERSSTPAVEPPSAPEPPRFRPDDARPRLDLAALEQRGIRQYASRRLVLVTDIDPEVAAQLPPVVDQLYDALCDYFGPPQPDRQGSDWQATGFLMRDQQPFRELGLLPENLPPFEHGRHRDNQFWMNEQTFDYYRRHLLLHEVTHCFMTFRDSFEAPVWYFEGMAELFATHTLTADGTARFRVFPTTESQFAGFGRIKSIQEAFREHQARTLANVMQLEPIEFLKVEPYAWSWAACVFLTTHPRYESDFAQFGSGYAPGQFATRLAALTSRSGSDLEAEWPLFVANLCYGYEAPLAAVELQSGDPLSHGAEALAAVAAHRGWQSSGWLLQAGRRYELVAQGQVSLGSPPEVWTTTAHGVTFDYASGHPLGTLLGSFDTRSNDSADVSATPSLLRSFVIGDRLVVEPAASGTLYLRINDHWSSLSDNSGELAVRIRALPPSADDEAVPDQ